MSDNMFMDSLRAVCSCLRGALRMIVFCIGLLTLALEVFWFFYIKHSHTSIVLPEVFDHWLLYTYILFLIALTFYGLYASFFNLHNHLKWFSIATAINCVVLLVIMGKYLGPAGMEKENPKLLQQMEEYALHYNWNLDRTQPVDELSEISTDIWDMLQRENYCCGIKDINGASIWDKYRPKNVSADSYPPSCCQYDDFLQYCTKEVASRKLSCMSSIRFTEDFIAFIGGSVLAIGIIHSILAFILSKEL